MTVSTFSMSFLFSVFILTFSFNDTPTTDIYTLSLHDALPISISPGGKLRSGARLDGRRGSDAFRRKLGQRLVDARQDVLTRVADQVLSLHGERHRLRERVRPRNRLEEQAPEEQAARRNQANADE